ncbi:hypothetical protein MLD38_001124 [Melastoma candidum]|uniref:Uncharacterized protein n=1 Tax=Melastoma candidum TaxID=119954 RepID=A0ACB9SCC0_9MYRT|nr:hypothetical protein MLD38_001124 [Melastoma candidum]
MTHGVSEGKRWGPQHVALAPDDVRRRRSSALTRPHLSAQAHPQPTASAFFMRGGVLPSDHLRPASVFSAFALSLAGGTEPSSDCVREKE